MIRSMIIWHHMKISWFVCLLVARNLEQWCFEAERMGFFPNPLTRHNPIWEDRNLNVFSRSILDQCPPSPPLFLMMKKIKKDAWEEISYQEMTISVSHRHKEWITCTFEHSWFAHFPRTTYRGPIFTARILQVHKSVKWQPIWNTQLQIGRVWGIQGLPARILSKGTNYSKSQSVWGTIVSPCICKLSSTKFG